jgi:hypothetical protein
MAFRLWLRISKIYVALSSASERINEALKEHRTSPNEPARRP